MSNPHAGRLEGASDRPEFEAIRPKTRLVQLIENVGLAEVSLGRTETLSGTDTFTITFPSVSADALRLVVKLREGFSGGVLEWRVAD